jgi:periplasmic protein TonB
MATMTGRIQPPFPEPGPQDAADDEALFQNLVISNPRKARGWIGIRESIAAHVVLIAAAVLVPILWPAEIPELDYVKVLIYNPPPPPPPPLPKGSAVVEKTKPAQPVTPDPHPEKPQFTEPQVPKEEPLKPEARPPETEQAGSENGSDMGVAEGMEEGVEGGVVGGVPGGVLGGVIGGTGDTVVYDPDQQARPIRLTRPQYPQDAFVKKIEGTVTVEIVIDINGRVVQTRILRSIPALDAAAIECVKQWTFSPAIKNGHPVASRANAPVTFRIF